MHSPMKLIRQNDDIDQDKMESLEAKIRDIEGVDLHDPMQVVEMCPVLNVVVPKNLCVL